VTAPLWTVRRQHGPPAELHAVGLPAPVRRMVRWCEADRPALVVGSAQGDEVVDRIGAAAAGLSVVRRRSGGAAVVVGPGRLLWADVVLPAGDRLWANDVGVAPRWLGWCWARALEVVGVGPPAVHEAGLDRRRWGSLVCFAGIGPGEVVIGDRKVVGISQRRTREGALFQCAALLRWDPAEAVAGLALPALERSEAIVELADVAIGIDALAGHPVGPAEVERAFLAELARLG